MMKKSYVRNNYDYPIDDNPVSDGKVGIHKPRRNYWGNLYEEDTYNENATESVNYDYSDYDSEDDIDSYYSNDNYD